VLVNKAETRPTFKTKYYSYATGTAFIPPSQLSVFEWAQWVDCVNSWR